MAFMFGRNKKSAKATNNDFDFDLDMDLDWDMMDPGDGAGTGGAKNRKPVVQNSLDLGKGVAKAFAEPSNVKQFIRNMLPNEFGQYIDTYDEASAGIQEELQSIRTGFSKTSRVMKQSLNKVSSAGEQALPGKLGKLFGKMQFKENDDYEYNPQDNGKDRDGEIESTLGSLFGNQERIRQAERKVDEKKEVVKQALESRRHQVSSGILSNIDMSTQKQLAFHTKNTLNYYRASIKLKMQSYNTLLDLYGETKESNTVMLQALNDIKKNSALPEAVKEQFSEEFIRMSREKFQNKAHQALFGQGSFLGDFFKNIATSVSSTFGDVNDLGQMLFGTLGDGIESARANAEMNEEMRAFGGGSKFEDHGKDGATTVMGLMGSGAQKFLKKTKWGQKLLKGAGKAGFVHDNMGSILTKALEDGSLLKRFAGESLSQNESLQMLNDMLASLARSAATKGKNVELERAGYGMYGRDDKRDLNSKALTSVIPGYLSYILREITALRTGNDNVERLEFNYSKDGFMKASANRKDVITQAAGVDNIRAMASYRASMMDDLGLNEKALTPEERRYVMGVIIGRTTNGEAIDKAFLSNPKSFPLLPKKKQRLIPKAFAKASMEEGGEFEYMAKINATSLSSTRAMTVDKALLDGLINTGNLPTLIREGIVTERGNVDYKKFIQYINDYDFEGDEKINEAVRNRIQAQRDAEFNKNKGIKGAFSDLANKLKAQEQKEGKMEDITAYDMDEADALAPSRSGWGTGGSQGTNTAVENHVKKKGNGKSNKLFEALMISSTETNKTLRAIDQSLQNQKPVTVNQNDQVYQALVDNTAGANDLLAQVVGRLDNLQIIQQMNMANDLPDDKKRGFFGVFGKAISDTGRNTMAIGRWGKDFTKNRYKGMAKRSKFMWEISKRNAKLSWTAAKFATIMPAKAAWATGKFAFGAKFGSLKDGLRTNIEDRLAFGSEKAKAFLSGKKAKIVNLYDSVTGQILISAEKLKKGQYLDENGQIVRTIGAIKGRVYDTVEKRYIEYEEIKNTFMDENGKFRPMKMLGWIKDNALGGAMRLSTMPMRVGTAMAGKALGMMKKIANIQFMDIYLKGQESPILKASLFRQGAYYSAKTGEVIKSVKDIDSDVLDAQGNLIASLKELSGGMFDRFGHPIGGFFRTNWSIAKKTMKTGFGIARGLVRRINRAAVSSWRALKGGALSMMRGTKNIVNSVIHGGKNALDAAVASAMLLGETNTILTNIMTLLDNRLPGKKMFGDKDGDGIVDGSIADLKRKLKEKREKREAEKAAGGKEGLLSKGFSSLAEFIKNRKKKGEEDGEGGGSDDDTTIIAGGDGDGKDKKGKNKNGKTKNPKPKGKAGLLSRLWGGVKGVGGKGLGLVKGLGGKGLGMLGLGTMAAAGASSAASAAPAAGAATKGIFGKLMSGTGSMLGAGAKFAGRRALGALPFIGAGISGTSMINNYNEGNYGSAALDAGFLAMSIGSSLSMLRGLANPYVAAAALAVGAIAGGGYYGRRWWKRTKINEVGHARLLQYGFDPAEFRYMAAITELERLMEERSDKGQGVTPENFPVKEVAEIFGLDLTKPEQIEALQDWFQNRFSPVFQKFKSVMKQIDPKFGVEDAYTLDDVQKVTYFKNMRPVSGQYTSTVSPFRDVPALTKTGDDAIVYIDAELAKLEKSGAVKEATGKAAGNAAVKQLQGGGLGNSSVTAANNGEKAYADAVKAYENQSKAMALGGSGLAAAGVSVGTSTLISPTGSTVASPEGITDYYRIALYKIYGLETMNPSQVNAVVNVEQELNNIIRWRGTVPYFDANLNGFADKVARYFDIGIDDQEGMMRLFVYLKTRFIPVFLEVHKVMGANIGAWSLENSYKAQIPVKKMAIDAGSRASSPNGRSVWEYDQSPWKGIPLNTSMSSIQKDIEALDKQVNASNSSTAKAAAQAYNTKATNEKGWFESKWDSAKNAVSNAYAGAKSWLGGQWQNTKDAVSSVWNGEKSVGQALTDFWDETKENAMNSFAIGKGGNQELILSMYKAFRKAGFSDQQSRMMLAEVGRENSFRKDIIFGYHADPKNNAVNLGMFSWQGSRGKQLKAMLESRGLLTGSGMAQTQAALDTQAEFIMQEMKTTERKAGERFLSRPNISDGEAINILGGEYIRWALHNPKYRDQGLKNRAHWLGQVQSALQGAPIDTSGGMGDASGGLLAGANVGASMGQGNQRTLMGSGGMDAGVTVASAAQQYSGAGSNYNTASNMAGGVPTQGRGGATYGGVGGSASGGAGGYAASVGAVAGNQMMSGGLKDLLARATPELVELGKKYCKVASGVDIKGMRPQFMQLLYAAIGDYVRSGVKQVFTINSGNRSYQQQAALFAKYGPGRAARPGRSNHEGGCAVDISNNQIMDTKSGPVDKFFNSGVAGRWGFHRPILYRKNGKVWEPWHVEHRFVNKKGVDTAGGMSMDAAKPQAAQSAVMKAQQVAGKSNQTVNDPETGAVQPPAAINDQSKMTRTVSPEEAFRDIDSKLAGMYGAGSVSANSGLNASEFKGVGSNTTSGAMTGGYGNTVANNVELIQEKVRGLLGMGKLTPTSARKEFEQNAAKRAEAYKKANIDTPSMNAELDKVNLGNIVNTAGNKDAVAQVKKSIEASQEVAKGKDDITSLMLAEAKLQTAQLIQQTGLLNTIVKTMGGAPLSKEPTDRVNLARDMPKAVKGNPIPMTKGSA